MKDTGIKWLGKIPNNWEIKKIKYVLQDRIEKNNPIKSREILSLTAKQGVIPYSEKEGGGNKPKEDLSAYRLAYPGDIVMNSMNILSGSVGLSKYFGCVSPVYYMLRPFKAEDDVRFFNYIFQSTVFQRSLLGLGNGILMKESDNGTLNTIRMRIPMEKFGNLYIPITNSTEQKKIADFLDEKCAEIDGLIADLNEEISTLEEYKSSTITEVVCRGLDPDAEMKDSGVECIGEIPSNWNVSRFKYVVSSLAKGNGITKDDVIENGDTQCVRYGEIYSKYDNNFSSCVSSTNANKVPTKKFFSYGDLLFAGTGELVEEIGKNIVYLGDDECLAGGDIIIAKHNQNPSFLNYALNSKYAQYQKSRGRAKLKVVHISSYDIGNIVIALPDLAAQKKIADFLDEKCTEINAVICEKQEQISTLEQYKKSVIYEYTTGKKEVV
ncbi:MAG: restriction endonuclease subunit S [Ruminococcaceae bacterium]|nr:restriction endonuclease subunit S [Oscillospiraceae bacterium]